MKKNARILIVDDDPLFCRMFERTAEKANIGVHACRTLGEVFPIKSDRTFDVAVIDFCFGDFTALQVADLIGKDIPVILVSNLPRADVHFSDWPVNIHSFVQKSSGQQAILDAAIRAIPGQNTLAPAT
jgi:DNA-binding NtrC family response regulator